METAVTTVISYQNTRKTQGDEPRSLLASPGDPCVCTVYRQWPTTARRAGPPARPGLESQIRVEIPRPPERQLPWKRESQAVSLLMIRKAIAVREQAGDGGRHERRKLTCASKKSGSGSKVTEALGQVPITDLKSDEASITLPSISFHRPRDRPRPFGLTPTQFHDEITRIHNPPRGTS